MDAALNIDQSVIGQPWRWRRPPDAGARHGCAGRRVAARPRRSRATTSPATAIPGSATSCPTHPAFRTWTRARSGLPTRSRGGETIAIFGDYDVDGATSAALLVLLLRRLGAEPMVYIPDRLMEGYGPSGKALVELKSRGASVAVCVDCGAQAFDALEDAKTAGLDVIVVDHHQCASLLPVAYRADQSQPARRERGRRGARPSRRGRHGVPARRRAAARTAEPRLLRSAGRAEDHRPARPGRARHGRRRRAAQEPQPRLRHPGPQA